MHKIAVIGTGTWGTAAAYLAARNGHQVYLWGRDPKKTLHLQSSRRHPRLRDRTLPSEITIGSELSAVAQAQLVLWAVPTQYSRGIAEELDPYMRTSSSAVVSLSKGLEQDSFLRLSEVFTDVWGAGHYGCLSGPSHAEEVLEEQATGLVAAGSDTLCQIIVDTLHSNHLRIYTSQDLIGVEIGGALKNVIAIAAGICDGMGLGDNSKSLLITRGLAEMRRIGRACGAEDPTFAGLAGIGDLLTTCYSPYGRNLALGRALAQGHSMQDHLTQTGMVAEGAWTCRAAVALGQRYGVELPIASQVASVVWQATPVSEALHQLLSRSAKEENA